ncbi:MAG: hypothetical protein JRJ65_20055 [Deltaproteobacteria bacterium]|nr:hypothetical protein [Deltaproteobacteria bacterium]
MECIQKHVLCDECGNKDFTLLYNFSLRFHNINFSDELIYDRLVDEIYRCTECGKTFTKDEVEERLVAIKKKYKK